MNPCDLQTRCYEEMAPLVERMLLLARGEHWSALGPLEAQFSELAVQLRSLPPVPGGSAQCRLRHAQLHAAIQKNHQALRDLVLPELARLAAALRSMEWQQSLHNAYSRPDRALL